MRNCIDATVQKKGKNRSSFDNIDHFKRLLQIETFFNHHKKKILPVQVLMFLLFLILTIVPLYSRAPTAQDTVLTSMVLLSQFAFWGIWYGFCLLSVIFVGRLWCGVLCPLGALSEWVGNIGLRKSIPRWVKWDGWLIVLFVVVTIFGQTLDVRDDVFGLALLFLYIFALAIVVGFLFGKNNSRPWCRYFCPIGKILGVVSRVGCIDFIPNRGEANLPSNTPYYIDGRLCPTGYNLPYKRSTNNCIACGKCAYGKKNAGLGIYFRPPSYETLNIMQYHPNWYEGIFILLAPGLSAGGFLWLILHQYQIYYNKVGSWFLENNYMFFFKSSPMWIGSHTWNQSYSWLDVTMITSYMVIYGLWSMVVSGSLIALASLVLKDGRHSFVNTFLKFTYQYIPIAILSIVIGLCGKFFQVMVSDFGMSVSTTIGIKVTLVVTSVLWTVFLLWRAIKRHKKGLAAKTFGLLVLLVNVAIITAMWWPAIANYKYMSKVEQIRQHVVTPTQGSRQ